MVAALVGSSRVLRPSLTWPATRGLASRAWLDAIRTGRGRGARGRRRRRVLSLHWFGELERKRRSAEFAFESALEPASGADEEKKQSIEILLVKYMNARAVGARRPSRVELSRAEIRPSVSFAYPSEQLESLDSSATGRAAQLERSRGSMARNGRRSRRVTRRRRRRRRRIIEYVFGPLATDSPLETLDASAGVKWAAPRCPNVSRCRRRPNDCAPSYAWRDRSAPD